MPWTSPEAITHEKRLDENGDRERYVGGNSTHGENRTYRHTAPKDQEQETDTNRGVEPHSVNRRIRNLVNALDPPTHGEAVIAGISERDSGRSDHAALAHGEAADNGEAEDCEGDLLRHDLDEVGGPWLAEI